MIFINPGSDYISDLAWSRFGVEPVALSDVAVGREVFRVLGRLPPRPFPEEKRVWKWMSEQWPMYV